MAEHGIDSDDEGKEEGTGSELKGERAFVFFDILVVRQTDGSVRTKVYRKDTYTDQTSILRATMHWNIKRVLSVLLCAAGQLYC